MNEQYDSAVDTEAHVKRVMSLINVFVGKLCDRSIRHDDSKFSSPEKEIFDVVTPKLKAMTYGSDEYKASLVDMKPALDHHYANNRHHPEHFANGVNEMNLVDLCEMLADWKAATERHADGDINKSIEINTKRFGLSEQLANTLKNTVKDFNWHQMNRGDGKKEAINVQPNR